MTRPTAPAEPVSRRERRKRETRRRLVDAAMRLFRERGFEGTRVEDITELADVAVGTFFNYFPAKEAVLADFHRGWIRASLEHASRVRARTARTRFREQFLWSVSDITDADARLHRILVAELLAKPSLLRRNRDVMERLFRVYDAWIDDGKERGEVRAEVDTRTASLLLQEVFYHNVIRWAGDPSLDLRRRVARRLEIIFGGLETR